MYTIWTFTFYKETIMTVSFLSTDVTFNMRKTVCVVFNPYNEHITVYLLPFQSLSCLVVIYCLYLNLSIWE